LLPVTVEKRISNLLVLAGPATCLAISPWFNFDPINLIKVLVLTCCSFSAIGLLIPYFRTLLKQAGKTLIFILLAFCSAMFSTFLFSGADKSQQFWGVFGRSTGILSYIALVLILLVSAVIISPNTYKRIAWSLVITVSIMSTYCVIQIAKLDPISWSAYFPFGTLGNVNFLSGFMGVGLVTVFVFATSNLLDSRLRFGLVGLFFIGLFVLYESDSTQGIVALVVGIASFMLVKSWFVNKPIFMISLFLFASGFVALVLGLFDKGPLRALIYQFTVLYRADYMHAGIGMLLNKPLTGVGIDSYDDWYRAERGIISAMRTSLNRTANSAHNISIDIAAGGGFPLLIAYLSLLGAIGFAIYRSLHQGRSKDPVFMALAMSWVAYQVQASVSINQIGVGVWGWILGGALLGYSKLEPYVEGEKLTSGGGKRGKGGAPNTPPAIPVISSSIMLLIGFVLAFLPLKTDADFATAAKTGSGEKLLEISSRPTVNTFMLAKSASDSLQSNLVDIAKTITDRLNTKFPRNLMGYLIAYDNPASSSSERTTALQAINRLDPFVAICYRSDASTEFRKLLDKLPNPEKYKLARGWGMVGMLPSEQVSRYTFAQVPSDQLLSKIQSFCGY
jgi:O-antigen ligase